MGNDEMAFVDDQLRVYGVDGWRVADASVMPMIPASNVNAACVMPGEKVADLIRFPPSEWDWRSWGRSILSKLYLCAICGLTRYQL